MDEATELAADFAVELTAMCVCKDSNFETETVEQAFAALKTAVPFDYAINDHEIFIRSSKKTMP